MTDQCRSCFAIRSQWISLEDSLFPNDMRSIPKPARAPRSKGDESARLSTPPSGLSSPTRGAVFAPKRLLL
eukprot:scaffold1642_cov252-Pinguiococcus_pyrenoidosus.AAC.21